MSKVSLFLSFFLWGFPGALLADEPLTIYVWGTGSLVAKAFNAIAALFAGMPKELLYLAVGVGLFSTLFKVIPHFSLAPVWKLWLVPTLLTLTLFIAPTEKVAIYDHLVRTDSQEKVYEIDSVPWLLATASYFLNNIGEGLKDLLTDNLHETHDLTYDWTGHMFGGETLLKTRRAKIIDGTVRKNLRNFCTSCVAVDLDLGLYTLKDLENQTDVLSFFISNTSDLRIRSFNYQYSQADKAAITTWPDQKQHPLPGDTLKVSCKAGAKLIQDRLRDNLYRKETSQMLYGMLGDQYQALFNLSKHASIRGLIEQQITIDALKTYTYGKPLSFAARRGEQIQYEQGKTLAQMAATSIVYMYGAIQVIIYLLFPIVVVLGLCFLGFKAIFGWLFLLTWVSTWPSIFVIIKTLGNWIWSYQTKIKHLSEQGYNLLTSEAFCDLYTFVEGWVGFLLVLVAPLSMALLYLAQKGSANAVAHLLGGIGSSMQGAATTAAAEATTGTYHYRSVADNNVNIGNRSIMQQNMAPLYRADMMSMMGIRGETATSAQGTHPVIKENISQLADQISSSQIVQTGLQGQITAAEEKIQGSNTQFNEEIGQLSHLNQGLQEHYAAHFSKGKGYNDQASNQFLEQASAALSKNEDVAEKWGLSTEKALAESLSVGTGKKFGLGGEAALRKNYTDLYGKEGANRYSDMLQLYDSYQKMVTLSANEDVKIGNDEGLRQYRDFAESWNKAHKLSDQKHAAFSERESALSTLSQLQNNTLTLNKNLSNEFVDWLDAKETGKSVLGVLQDRPLRDQLAQEFFQERYPNGYQQPKTPNVYKNATGEVDFREGFEVDRSHLKSPTPIVTDPLDTAQNRAAHKKEHLGDVRSGAANLKTLFQGNADITKFNEDWSKVERLSDEKMEEMRTTEKKANELNGAFAQETKAFEDERESSFFKRALKQSSILNAVGGVFSYFFLPKMGKDEKGNPVPQKPKEIITGFSHVENLSDEEKKAIIDAKFEEP